MMQKMRTTSLTASLITVALMATLAGCSAPGASQGAANSTAPTDAVTVGKDIASLGDITLTLWDQEVRDGQSDQFSRLLADFQTKYPNVKIDRVASSFDDLQVTLPMALSDPNPPDVVQANNGRNDMGAYVSAGQLTDLAPYAKAYGWVERFPQNVLKDSMYSADGKSFGEGNLYGLSQIGEVVGIFYNKKKLGKLGLSVPATFADFEAALEAAKAAGEIPIMLGNSEGWPAGHVLGIPLGIEVPAAQLDDLGMGNPGASWNTPEALAGVIILESWIKAGYFNEGVNGQTDAAVADRFAKGEGVFTLAGSWNVARFEELNPTGIGFIAPPPVTVGGPSATIGGPSLPYAIPSGAKHKDAAAAFIDFITSDDAMKVLAETDNIPIIGAESLMAGDGLLNQAAVAFGQVSTKGSLLPYLDWSTSTFGDEAMAPRLQDLFAGKIDAQGVIDAFEENYAASVK